MSCKSDRSSGSASSPPPTHLAEVRVLDDVHGLVDAMRLDAPGREGAVAGQPMPAQSVQGSDPGPSAQSPEEHVRLCDRRARVHAPLVR